MGHTRKQLLFAVLGFADLALTCWLLAGSGGHVYEANPVAGWLLANHGWAGLAGLKFASSALFLGLSLHIARSRPRTASFLLWFGCLATAVVVVYSAALACSPLSQPGEDSGPFWRELEQENQRVVEGHRRHAAFMAQLSGDLADARCTLREASARLAASERGRQPRWQSGVLATYPGRPFVEAAAVVAMGNAIEWVRKDPSKAWMLSLRLEREYRLVFGAAPPPWHGAVQPKARRSVRPPIPAARPSPSGQALPAG